MTEYQKACNELITLAVRQAHKEARATRLRGESRDEAWSRAFHRIHWTLCVDAGLRKERVR